MMISMHDRRVPDQGCHGAFTISTSAHQTPIDDQFIWIIGDAADNVRVLCAHPIEGACNGRIRLSTEGIVRTCARRWLYHCLSHGPT